MSPVAITLIAVFIGTASLCAGVGISLLGKHRDHPLDRLARLNRRTVAPEQSALVLKQEMWAESAAELADLWKRIGFSPRSIVAWFAQAELPFPAMWVFPLSLLTGVACVAATMVLKAPLPVYPIAAIAGVSMPMMYVVWRRKQRINLFSSQLPDALELMSSSLRSGNTIQSSMQIIAEELMPPVSREFGNVSESIRLGIPVEQALDEMAARVANPDLEFFVTAVAMQRSCGGDLSEILDKISWLIRERFHIQGQVQALTGEGRMSGAVLMALPVVLFIAVYTLNPDYVMLLFTEPLGQKMLGGAIFMQLVGAYVIKRIIDIKIQQNNLVMSPQIIVALSVAVSVTCLLLGLVYWWRDARTPTADDRLTTVVNREFGAPTTAQPIQNPQNKGLLNLIAPRLSQGLKPRTGIEQQQLKLKMARAGFNGNHSAELFLGLKMICLIGGGFLGSIVGAAVWGAHQSALVCTGLSACLAFYLPDIILRSLTSKRQEEILLALPNAVDLLIVAIEVGQGLDAAIRRVTKELERNSLALSQEFSLYNLQLQMGRSRSEALHDLGMRSGVPDMNSFATVLIQADRFGVSVAKTMRQLSESARRKRRQRAEERAQKTAVKMLFPLVLFIFPGIFVVLVGPAMLLLWRDLSSMN